jgi:phosphohistidine phosphatase SixA
MQVILFRHGPAGRPDSDRWPSDVDRPLTPRGIVRTRSAARGIGRATNGVSIILTSPYVRALGTARIAGEALGVNTVETLDALSAGRGSRGVFVALSRLQPEQTVILVGRQPDLRPGCRHGGLADCIADQEGRRLRDRLRWRPATGRR